MRIRTAIIGLIILSLYACKEEQESLQFHEDIAPIIYDKCTPCHRTGGAGPFRLESFEDVHRKKSTIVKVTSSGYMPPWPADRNYSHFSNERFLSEEQIEKIRVWVKQGAKEGDKSLGPEVPTFSHLSRMGRPDTTIWLDSIYIEAANRDRFYMLKIPIELGKDKYVKAMEFIPGNKKLVHHVNGRLLNFKNSKNLGERMVLDIELGEEAFDSGILAMNLKEEDGEWPERIHSATNYLPGVELSFYPEGIGGFRMANKSIFLADDIHYAPSGKAEWDRSYVNLFFTDEKPKRPIQETAIGTNGQGVFIPPLIIPPNKISSYTVFAEVPEDISILTVNPHMHLLGQSFKAYAVAAKGDTIPLISIPTWDFRWQYFYTYPTMIKVPKGSIIYVEASFDNTKDNPNNPNNPPIQVSERKELKGAGMRTTDEMLQFIISWLPYQVGDESIALRPN